MFENIGTGVRISWNVDFALWSKLLFCEIKCKLAWTFLDLEFVPVIRGDQFEVDSRTLSEEIFKVINSSDFV